MATGAHQDHLRGTPIGYYSGATAKGLSSEPDAFVLFPCSSSNRLPRSESGSFFPRQHISRGQISLPFAVNVLPVPNTRSIPGAKPSRPRAPKTGHATFFSRFCSYPHLYARDWRHSCHDHAKTGHNPTPIYTTALTLPNSQTNKLWILHLTPIPETTNGLHLQRGARLVGQAGWGLCLWLSCNGTTFHPVSN